MKTHSDLGSSSISASYYQCDLQPVISAFLNLCFLICKMGDDSTMGGFGS